MYKFLFSISKRSIIGWDNEVALSMKCNIIIMIEKVIALSRFLLFVFFVFFLGYKDYSSLMSEFNEVLNAGASSTVYFPLVF